MTRRLHAYLRWRNANKRDPKLLAQERKRRAEIRAEQQRRWVDLALAPPDTGPRAGLASHRSLPPRSET